MAAASTKSDRAALLKAFDEARTGVRGLVESGVSTVPDLFVHTNPYASVQLAPPGVSIPVVDLSLPAHVLFGPTPPNAERIPSVCRSEVIEWEAHAAAVARAVMALLSQGLGLGDAALEETSCLEGKLMVCHYYPVCPEPERTMGLVPHTDPGVLTVLEQDGVGGLQVKHTNGDGESFWVDVRPAPGALVINVGDLLQV
ncbi:unnamed protein product [Triticum turgidum subsp. durum]|uniref:Fe2OG dioxygenase domain-containing protein n=1 Tax=Triticum turgidum subsp. durum TaxID=4567 RepID=A0A9R1B243_TRITD|nr:unnamed protein product [Triticum turgidum subsp. durum]